MEPKDLSFVEHCKKEHSLPDICCPDPGLELNNIEIRALARYFMNQYLPYDDAELHDVVKRILRASNELDKPTSLSTQGT